MDSMQPSQRTRAEILNDISILEHRIVEYEKLLENNDQDNEAHLIAEQTYRNIFQKSQDIQIIVNVNNLTIIETNTAMQQILGFEEKNIVGQHFTRLFPSGSRFSKSFEDIKNYGHIFVEEFKRTDGSLCIMDLTATLIPWNKENAILVTLRDVTQRIHAEKEKEHALSELKEAMEKIKTLRGLLPICSYCKKIRDDHGYWQQLETYMEAHSQAEFSHGICPECIKEHFPDLYNEKDFE